MRVLALETSTLAGGVALVDGERVVGQILLDIALTHSERLMAMVDRLLQDCHWKVGDLEGLAVSIGPGSFTGLRVGAATAKGLALGLDLPVALVPTLDVLASNLPFADRPVCPLIDARKGEVYTARYRWTLGVMERHGEYLALAPAEAVERLNPPVIVLGDGIPACRPYFGRYRGEILEAPAALSMPSAALVGQLGHALLASGHGVDGDGIAPIYLRPSGGALRSRDG